MEKYQDRARGMLVGLAVGDALGAPVEFLPEPSDVYIKKMGDKIEHFYDSPVGPAGAWTDDTSMALCVADSLLACGGYDSYDIMSRFERWVSSGYRTVDNKPAADVGGQTRRAIEEFKNHPIVFADDPKTESAGNGAIMRLAPIVIANTFPPKNNTDRIPDKDLWPLANMAVLSCRETHNSISAECVTDMFATALYSAIIGYSKSEIAAYAERGSYRDNDEYGMFWIENAELLINRWRNKNDRDNLKNLGGYIVDAFAIALWGMMNYDNFKDGMMAVIRLGGDTDTNGAIYGQLAGAYYGYNAIPKEWREQVFKADELVEIADKLLEMRECPVIRTRFEDDKNFKEKE